MGRGSATPLVLCGSALSGDPLLACSASCFTILGDSFRVTLAQHLHSIIHETCSFQDGLLLLKQNQTLLFNEREEMTVLPCTCLGYLLDHQLCNPLTVALVVEPNAVDSHCEMNTNTVTLQAKRRYKKKMLKNKQNLFHSGKFAGNQCETGDIKRKSI